MEARQLISILTLNRAIFFLYMLCNDMGLSMTAAFTIFAKTVTREKRIPFEVSADPFYSESNLKHLQRVVAELNAGKSVEHEIIEN